MDPVAEPNAQAPSPRVSICTSVLNQGEWLKETIASVIAQTFKDWEHIIVDDGSTEDIKAIVDSFADPRIKYHRFPENRGIPHGCNFALRQAKGEFVAIVSADETLCPHKLTQQLEYMDSHPGVDCVWGLPQNGPMGLRPLWEQYALRAHNRSREQWIRTLVNLEGVPLGAASFLMRRSVMDSLGYMDESLTVFGDHELYCRFFEKHVGVVLPYRWSNDKPASPQSVRAMNAARAEAELAQVRAKHPLIIPSVDGGITVAIPCHNHAKYLKDAVDSVLAQTFPPIEIMILDDGSTDDFKTVAQQFTDPRIRLMAFPENMGIQETMNQMAFRAKGEFFAVLAADDTMDPNTLGKLMAKFAENPWLEFAATQTDFMTAKGEKATPQTGPAFAQMFNIKKAANKSREEWLAELYSGNQYFGVGIYRTKMISELGGWKKEYKVVSDYEMYLNILQRENIAIVEEDLTHTRVHGGNYSLLSGKRAEELPALYFAARKNYYRPMMKVAIATPFYELKGFSPYIVSLANTLRLLTAVGIDHVFAELSGDSYVHRARNTICDKLLRDPSITDLFFIDSDMSWDPVAFVRMLMVPELVVGASYPVKNNWDSWTSLPQPYEENGKHILKGKPLPDGSALVEAMVLAGGFLRIKREALEQFREHYPDDWYTEPSTDKDHPERRYTEFFMAGKFGTQFHGEDHWFSKKLRDMGMKMYIYPNVDITHWGYKDFGGNFHKSLQARAAAEKASAGAA